MRGTAALALLLAGSALCLTVRVYAENELNPGNHGIDWHAGWKFEGWIESVHLPATHDEAVGNDSAILHIRRYPALEHGTTWVEYTPIGDLDPGPTLKFRATRDRLSVIGATPLAPVIKGRAERDLLAPTGTWYVPSVTATSDKWGPSKIRRCKRGSVGFEFGAYGTNFENLQWCHCVDLPGATGAISVPQAPQSLTRTCEFKDGGRLCFVEDSTGDWCPERDLNGDLVWSVSQSLRFRVTAEATFVSTTSISGVTYTIENLTDEDRDFVIGSVACGSLPGGWSGTVLANGEASLYVPVSPPEACHLQDSQVDLFDGSELDCGFPVQMYVPASQREYVGGNSIASAVHVSGTTRNTISFSVTGQPATTAVLYRVDDGAYVRVATAAGSFTSGNTYVMHDEDSLPGTTIYVVQTGRGVNGEYSSQPEEVVW